MSSVNFSNLLKKPAGEAEKPKALPVANYPGVIKAFEFGDNNKNKTPYVRLMLAITGWSPDLGVEDRTNDDPTKRTLRRDYYLTPDALWRLDELFEALGMNAKGRSYEEVIPELAGQHVSIEVQQYVNQSTNEIGNQVGKLMPPA